MSGATWSPNTVTWSGNNRTHMVRVPGPGRFELRLADGDVVPLGNGQEECVALLAATRDHVLVARRVVAEDCGDKPRHQRVGELEEPARNRHTRCHTRYQL